jgi:hypothetical protein
VFVNRSSVMGLINFLIFYRLPHPLIPSPASYIFIAYDFLGWRGELKREGATPPLKISSSSQTRKNTIFIKVTV